ncbi:unnamed protein product [Rhodiola kirilowii]
MIKLRFVLRSWTTWSYRLLGKNDNHSYLVNFVSDPLCNRPWCKEYVII